MIRDAQWARLAEPDAERFLSRVVAHVVKAFPEACQGMEERAVAELARRGVAQAAQWRMRTELDVVRFVDLVFALGPAFDQAPKVAAILASERSAGSRIDSVVYQVRHDAGY